MADATDSKSVDGDIVWVQVPPPAPSVPESLLAVLDFLFCAFLFLLSSKAAPCILGVLPLFSLWKAALHFSSRDAVHPAQCLSSVFNRHSDGIDFDTMLFALNQ